MRPIDRAPCAASSACDTGRCALYRKIDTVTSFKRLRKNRRKRENRRLRTVAPGRMQRREPMASPAVRCFGQCVRCGHEFPATRECASLPCPRCGVEAVLYRERIVRP